MFCHTEPYERLRMNKAAHNPVASPSSATESRDGRESQTSDGGRSPRRPPACAVARYIPRLEDRIAISERLAERSEAELKAATLGTMARDLAFTGWTTHMATTAALKEVLDDLRYLLRIKADTCGAAQELDGPAAIRPVRESFLEETSPEASA